MISCDQEESPPSEMVTTAVATTAANVVPEDLMDTSRVSSKRYGTLTGGCHILPGSDEPPSLPAPPRTTAPPDKKGPIQATDPPLGLVAEWRCVPTTDLRTCSKIC